MLATLLWAVLLGSTAVYTKRTHFNPAVLGRGILIYIRLILTRSTQLGSNQFVLEISRKVTVLKLGSALIDIALSVITYFIICFKRKYAYLMRFYSTL